MTLRLRIVSDHRRLLGDRSTVVFRTGGSIGRSADNDWVLPDPQRYVSAHHARIHFRRNSYIIEDLSTNGVYVNDDDRPLSKLGPYELKNGDILRMGEYQIVVMLESAENQPAATGANAVPTRIEELKSIARAAQTDLGAALNLDELLVPSPPQPVVDARISGIHNAYGQAVAAVAPLPSAAVAEDEDPDDQAVARRIARLARAASRVNEQRAGSAPVPLEVQNGLQAFCRGAGIDADKLPAGAQARLLHLAGVLLREALLGLKDLERSREEMRNKFRVDLHADPDDPRPSLARSMIEELLIDILSQHESRRLDAIQWLREAISATKAHEQAVIEAMHAAFVDFITRLSPKELETRFQRTVLRATPVGADPARNWALFYDFYRSLTERQEGQLPHTFVETFANAYKEHVTKKEKD